jgi:ADP-ribose pyrophosphatase
MAERELTWTISETVQIADCKVFSVHRNMASPPGEDVSHDFYVLRAHNWVNVIPITADGQVVLIEQYRHGVDAVTLEIPGGMIERDEASSMTAAIRELSEETGYAAEEMIFIGRTQPNPALQDNYCDTYLAKNAKQVQAPQFDGNEDIELKVVPYETVPKLIESGAITHALVIVAFHYLSLYEKRQAEVKS